MKSIALIAVACLAVSGTAYARSSHGTSINLKNTAFVSTGDSGNGAQTVVIVTQGVIAKPDISPITNIAIGKATLNLNSFNYEPVSGPTPPPPPGP